MCDYKPRYQVPLGLSALPINIQHQQVKLLQQLADKDPRKNLSCRLKIERKVLNLIKEKLEQNPNDSHQRFLLETHQKKEQNLLEALRLQNTDTRYHELEKWVNKKIQVLNPNASQSMPNEDSEISEEKARLNYEKSTWEKMILRVREKLIKKPGDTKLMRLLGEHQGRLLYLQEQLRQQEHGYKDEILVLEATESQHNAHAPVTERMRLEQEIDVLTALCEKTRQRLFAKPELLHLKALIQHHEVRIKKLTGDLNALLNEDRTPSP